MDINKLEILIQKLKIPIESYKQSENDPFSINLYFQKQKIGEILFTIFNEQSTSENIDTSRINWFLIYQYYKVEIQSILPQFDVKAHISPLKYKEVIVRNEEGDNLGIYKLDYKDQKWEIVS